MKLTAPLLRARLSLALPPRSPFCAKPDIYSSVWRSQGLLIGNARRDTGTAARRSRSEAVRWLPEQAGTKQPRARSRAARHRSSEGSEEPQRCHHASSSATGSHHHVSTPNVVGWTKPKESDGLIAPSQQLDAGAYPHPSTSGATLLLCFWRRPSFCNTRGTGETHKPPCTA